MSFHHHGTSCRSVHFPLETPWTPKTLPRIDSPSTSPTAITHSGGMHWHWRLREHFFSQEGLRGTGRAEGHADGHVG